MPADFKDVKVGDTVTRVMAGEVMMELRVTAVDDDFIYCGPRNEGWKFHRDTGGEVDEYLEWDGLTRTGSYLSHKKE